MNEKPVRTPVIVYQTKQEPTDDFTGKSVSFKIFFKITGHLVDEIGSVYVIGCISYTV